MNRSFRHLALAMLAAPLLLGLSACGKKSEDGAQPSGEPVARVAPPAGKVWSDVVTKTPEGGYLMGNPEAPIKLIEFGSLTCSHCAEFAEKSGAELRDDFIASGRVSFEFRNFVRDPLDVTAAQLTRCGAPESFFALTEQAFANQAAMFQKTQSAGEAAYEAAIKQPDSTRGPALGQITGLTEFFAARGIAKDQANACLANAAEARALVEGADKAGKQYDIQGTPAFVINGEKADMTSWEEVKARLQALGAR